MDALELLDLIQKGESSNVQFKVRVKKKDYTKSAYDVGTEMVAFSNSKGGVLVIGVDDKTGEINGLSFEEIQETNQLLSNVATNNVNPQIYIETETVNVNGNNIVIAYIPEGISKPHTDNKGIIWLKNGSDKRTVVAREEMARLLQSSGNLYADETKVSGTTINDIDEKFFKDFVIKKYENNLEDLGLSIPNLLTSMGMLKDGNLSLGGLILFGKNPQQYKPTFTVQCISIRGDEISSDNYRSKKEPFTGNLFELYEKALSFITQNLNEVQNEEGFNSQAQLEIPIRTIQELLVNALIHRDYFIHSSIECTPTSENIFK